MANTKHPKIGNTSMFVFDHMKPNFITSNTNGTTYTEYAGMNWPETLSLSFSFLQLALAWYDFNCDMPLRRQMVASSLLHILGYVCEKSLHRRLSAWAFSLYVMVHAGSAFTSMTGLYVLFASQSCDSIPYYLFSIRPLIEMAQFVAIICFLAPAIVQIIHHHQQYPNLHFALGCVPSLVQWVGTHGIMAAPRWELPSSVAPMFPFVVAAQVPVAQPRYRIPISVLEEDVEDPCNICLTQMIASQRVSTLRCRHQFHLPCMEEAARFNPRCPVCRHPLEVDQ